MAHFWNGSWNSFIYLKFFQIIEVSLNFVVQLENYRSCEGKNVTVNKHQEL